MPQKLIITFIISLDKIVHLTISINGNKIVSYAWHQMVNRVIWPDCIGVWPCAMKAIIKDSVPRWRIVPRLILDCLPYTARTSLLRHRCCYISITSIFEGFTCSIIKRIMSVILGFILISDERSSNLMWCVQVARKLAMVEADLERAEERAESGES